MLLHENRVFKFDLIIRDDESGEVVVKDEVLVSLSYDARIGADTEIQSEKLPSRLVMSVLLDITRILFPGEGINRLLENKNLIIIPMEYARSLCENEDEEGELLSHIM